MLHTSFDAFFEHINSLSTESDYNRERFSGECDHDGECYHDGKNTLLAETADTETWECDRCGLVETFPKGKTNIIEGGVK